MKQGLPDLETAMATIDLLDHRSVEWQRVRRTAYLIHQHLRYDYPGPIYDLNQRLVIIPPEQYGDQRCIDYRFEVSSPGAEIFYQNDASGNRQIKLFIAHIAQRVDFETWILVERCVEYGPYYVPASLLTDARFLEPSALTFPDKHLRQAAARLLADGKQGIALVQQINAWVYQVLRYEHEITDIDTPAAEALALGRGVCQDYAHIMIALCRLCRLPARYVSGHLLGEGGTHAWVEVLLPVDGRSDVARVVPFDPTHGRQAGLSYVTVSVGRDYFDVAPTSGTFRAAYRGQLSTRKRVGLAMLEYADNNGE